MQLRREMDRRLAWKNSADFARVYRNIEPGAHQYEMARWADDETILYEAEFWPRDHGKSEIFAISLPLRRVCEDPNIRILIVQKTKDEAMKTLGVIKAELETNKRLRAAYSRHWHDLIGRADIVNKSGMTEDKEGTWQAQRIYCKRTRRGKDPTVEAVGVGGAITGGHFDLIILDDVEDDENTKTKDRLAGLVRWFTGTIMQLREPHTKIIVVGTVKTLGNDIYNLVRSNPMWRCRTRSCLVSDHTWDDIEYREIRNKDGQITDVEIFTEGVEVLWPEKWPLKSLVLDYLAAVNRHIWKREKLNDLRVLAGRIFKREWFDYYDKEPAMKRVIQIWDTAFSEKESADWSVCGTLGLGADNFIYVMRIFRARLAFPDLIRAMKAEAVRMGPEEILIEDRGSGKSAIQTLKRESGLPVVGIPPEKDKVARANAVTPYYESGRVRHKRGAPWLDAFEDELVMFPDSEYDDQVDVISYGIPRLMRKDYKSGSSRYI